jgi:hypothetical protein
VNDDFRVRVRLHDRDQAVALVDRLERGGLEHELESGAGDRVIVSIDGSEVFLYAATREQASAAVALLQRLARGSAWGLEEIELRRWHPTAEEWEDPDVPLPTTPEDEAAERAALIARERAESAALGAPEYEVRVQCGTHRDTVELSDRLASEGLACVRRWRYLLVGLPDEDAARQLADRLVAEVPPGATVTVEASAAAVVADTPANPFAVFGGLGL